MLGQVSTAGMSLNVRGSEYVIEEKEILEDSSSLAVREVDEEEQEAHEVYREIQGEWMGYAA